MLCINYHQDTFFVRKINFILLLFPSFRYERVDEIIWVKTNQLQRIIRTGRTGHWLNHGKEHCLVCLSSTIIMYALIYFIPCLSCNVWMSLPESLIQEFQLFAWIGLIARY